MGITRFGAGAPPGQRYHSQLDAALNHSRDVVPTPEMVHPPQPHLSSDVVFASARPGSDADVIRTDLSRVFCELRSHLGWALPDLARQLQTDSQTISALERADVDALPEWRETERVVRTYLGLIGVDATPVLRGLVCLARRRQAEPRTGSDQCSAGPLPDVQSLLDRLRAVNPLLQGWHPRAVGDGPSAQLFEATSAGRSVLRDDSPTDTAVAQSAEQAKAPERRRRTTVAAAFVLPVVLIIVGTQAGGVAPLVHALPAPTYAPLRQAHDWLMWQVAPVRRGHRWIEVSDPRSRKQDKLPVRRQSG